RVSAAKRSAARSTAMRVSTSQMSSMGRSRLLDWFYQRDTSTLNFDHNVVYSTILNMSINLLLRDRGVGSAGAGRRQRRGGPQRAGPSARVVLHPGVHRGR